MRQTLNDPELLELMLRDDAEAQSKLSATARWATYSSALLPYLRHTGLDGFRSVRSKVGEPAHVLASFGAVDLNLGADTPDASPENLIHRARTCFVGPSARPIDDLLPSRIGDPEGFEVEGRFYTLSWLNFYCRYAYVSRFVDFDSAPVIVEVGPGSGKQAEMIKKAHPAATLVLFDLPTQLYVCNQYLTAVFAGCDEVVDYRAGRNLRSLSEIHRGKINILPYWKFPLVEGATYDLFWNAASLQEMARADGEQLPAYRRQCRCHVSHAQHQIRRACGGARPARGDIGALHRQSRRDRPPAGPTRVDAPAVALPRQLLEAHRPRKEAAIALNARASPLSWRLAKGRTVRERAAGVLPASQGRRRPPSAWKNRYELAQ